jgi:hypothetical protein
MKNQTFETRTKSVSKNSKGYQLAEELLKYGVNRINTCWTSGKGRFTTNMNYHQDTIDVLETAGLMRLRDFITGNDSPRGGKTGLHIELTSNGKRKRIVN